MFFPDLFDFRLYCPKASSQTKKQHTDTHIVYHFSIFFYHKTTFPPPKQDFYDVIFEGYASAMPSGQELRSRVARKRRGVLFAPMFFFFFWGGGEFFFLGGGGVFFCFFCCCCFFFFGGGGLFFFEGGLFYCVFTVCVLVVLLMFFLFG